MTPGLESEKGITILAKNTADDYVAPDATRTTVNITDTRKDLANP